LCAGDDGVLEAIDVDLDARRHGKFGPCYELVDGRRNAPLREPRRARSIVLVERRPEAVVAVPGAEMAEIQLVETGPIRERDAVGLHEVVKAVRVDVPVQNRVVLRFGLEGEHAGATRLCREDRVHAYVRADVEQDVVGAELADPGDGIWLLREE